jgi:hypothetical protein
MYHTIEFTDKFSGDLEISCKHRLERIVLPSGTRVRAQIRPYVRETIDGPVEVADLFFEDGTVTRGVPFASFSLLE